jgi:hypothetical protein
VTSLLLILALAMTPTRTDVLATYPTPTLTWEEITGAKAWRIWRCRTGTCALRAYTVGGVVKDFPANLGQWQFVAEVRPATVRSYPVSCGTYEYSVQAVGAGKRVANGGNVVRCP